MMTCTLFGVLKGLGVFAKLHELLAQEYTDLASQLHNSVDKFWGVVNWVCQHESLVKKGDCLVGIVLVYSVSSQGHQSLAAFNIRTAFLSVLLEF